MTTPATLVLGLDIGGTSTRALLADLDGHVHGTGRGHGANFTSNPVDDALAAISGAIRAALAGISDPATVRQAVIGTAGTANFDRQDIAHKMRQMWQKNGLTCPYEIRSDPEVAYLSATAEPDGTLLLCGTGALAARFENHRPVHTVDGHGWLLGDLGSGFWLGQQAVRSALASLDRLEKPGPLGQAVIDAALADGDEPARPWDSGGQMSPRQFHDLANNLVMKIYSTPPSALAGYAPLVTTAHDPEADRILRGAADHLLTAASVVRTDTLPTDPAAPLVLTGSLLTTPTPLRRQLEPQLTARWPKARIIEARNGAAGAAWLAASTIIDDAAAAARLHERLTSAST